MRKLTQFRQFYIIVVSYIYFTRIAVFLLGATLPFQLVGYAVTSCVWLYAYTRITFCSLFAQAWLRDFFSEGATVAFYVITGVKFRPGADNPYMQISKDDVSAVMCFVAPTNTPLTISRSKSQDEALDQIELGDIEPGGQVAV